MKRWFRVGLVSGSLLAANACSGGTPSTEAPPAATVSTKPPKALAAVPIPVEAKASIACGEASCNPARQICCLSSELGSPPAQAVGACATRMAFEDGFPDGDPYDHAFQVAVYNVMSANADSCAKVGKEGATIMFCDSSDDCGIGKMCCSGDDGPGGELPLHCATSCAGPERCAGDAPCRTLGTQCRGGTCRLALAIECGGTRCGGDQTCCTSPKTGKVGCMTYDACVANGIDGSEPMIEECDGPGVCAGTGFCVATDGRSRCVAPPVNLLMSELRCSKDADCSYQGPITLMNDVGCKVGKCAPTDTGMRACECIEPYEAE